MSDALAAICFGWLAIASSILLSIAGMLMKKSNLLFVVGVALIPFAYYLSNRLRNPFIVMPSCQFASAFAIRRGNIRMASLFLALFLTVVLWLAFVVLTR